jgi:tetratricopeptide (TPR) repeat protein
MKSIRYSQDDINKMDWYVFEGEVVDAIKFLYSKHNIKLVETQRTKDGGRDGEAHYVLAIGLGDHLSVNIKVFLEIKHRKQNVDKSDIGSHVIDAFGNKVTKVIFVANRGFTKTLNSWLDSFCGSVNMQYSLVPGKLILEWINAAHNGSSNALLTDETPVVCSNTRITGVKKFIDIRVGFSLDLSDAVAISADCYVRPDRPVFIRMELVVGDSVPPFQGVLAVDIRTHALGDIYPISILERAKQLMFMPGDRQHWTFVLWPKESGTWSAKDFHITLDESPVSIQVTSINKFHTPKRGLAVLNVGPQVAAETSLRQEFESWFQAKGTFHNVLLAHGGMGKSHLLARLRKGWHQNNLREVVLDGEMVRDDSDLILHAFSSLYPFTNNALGQEMTQAITQWMQGIGISEETAKSLAEDLCNSQGIKPNRYDVNSRIEVFFSMLAEASEPNGLIFVLEDLHKVAPSVLILLQETIRRLKSRGRGNVFFLLTSRPYKEGEFIDPHKQWLEQLNIIVGRSDVPVHTINCLSKHDARNILQATIPSLELAHCQKIISQVGTSPFALREATLYLSQIEVVQQVEANGTYLLVKPTELGRLLDHQVLHHATSRRLIAFFDSQEPWLREIMEAGACLGRQFPLEKVMISIAPELKQFDVHAALGVCSKWSLMAPSPVGRDMYEFDHDLVRNVVLDQLPPARHRACAEKLYTALPDDGNNILAASLAYQAGRATEAYDLSRLAAKLHGKRGRPADALGAHGIALMTLDPQWLQTIPDVRGHGIDVAVLKAPPCHRTFHDWRQRDSTILEILQDNLSSLNQVTSGSSSSSESLITEARMLCGRLGDEQGSAQLLASEGRMLFEQDNLDKAIQCHEEAERKYATLDTNKQKGRAQNLVRLSICLRQFDRREEALAVLDRALALRKKADWVLLSTVRNNTGAVYLSSNWNMVKYHWQKQLRSARVHGLEARTAHALASLSFINIFEDRIEEGIEQSEQALEIAQRNILENTIVRCNLNLSVAQLVQGKAMTALPFLLEAEEIALRHGIGRRLWRVFANMATTYELLGENHKRLARDMQTIAALEPYNWKENSSSFQSKKILSLLNIALREDESRKNEPNLFAQFPHEVASIINEKTQLVRNGKAEQLGGLLHKYLVEIAGKQRFLLTE